MPRLGQEDKVAVSKTDLALAARSIQLEIPEFVTLGLGFKSLPVGPCVPPTPTSTCGTSSSGV